MWFSSLDWSFYEQKEESSHNRTETAKKAKGNVEAITGFEPVFYESKSYVLTTALYRLQLESSSKLSAQEGEARTAGALLLLSSRVCSSLSPLVAAAHPPQQASRVMSKVATTTADAQFNATKVKELLEKVTRTG